MQKCTDTIIVNALSADISLTWRDWINDGKRLVIAEIARVLPMVKVWHHRKVSRLHLANLSDVLLDDIGLTADQARAECKKPFWMD